MKLKTSTSLLTAASLLFGAAAPRILAQPMAAPMAAPRFSTNWMDLSVSPSVDFYQYSSGTWLKNNPVPADKTRWAAFDQLGQRNWQILREILESARTNTSAPAHSPVAEVGAFYASAMDTNRLEQLGFKPLWDDFNRIAALKTPEEVLRLLADFQLQDIPALFGSGVSPDAKNSSIYAFQLSQGGLGLPDRDYYLKDTFADKRTNYQAHIARMFVLTGEAETDAQADAAKVLDLETALAKACKDRADLRDPIANYHKFTVTQAVADYPHLPLRAFLDSSGLAHLTEIVIGQPEFLTALDQMMRDRPLDDWKVYLRWHLLSSSAAFLHEAADREHFAFYGTVLRGQQQQEPRWQRAARVVDSEIGEALGQLYVEKNFPPEAKQRMAELVTNLKFVFHEHLEKVPWMSEATRAKALEKFARFTQKIGYPDKFRDYSSIQLSPTDYLGNIRRAALFENKREIARVGQPVDRTEWDMTPPTVNAYFSQEKNEIVFPAGILQPPFFDAAMDDAVNYGGIGCVIGHEMTHGYDDQGRKFDADGNLNDWWAPDDAKAFEARAQLVVNEYSNFVALPGVHINGRLTLGENLADLGGVTLAYDALERDLAQHPERRVKIDGLTPEQRFFISFAQVFRVNFRDTELRYRLTTDVHSPGQFRAVGAASNLQQFYDAFGIKPGDPMWRDPATRAVIW